MENNETETFANGKLRELYESKKAFENLRKEADEAKKRCYHARIDLIQKLEQSWPAGILLKEKTTNFLLKIVKYDCSSVIVRRFTGKSGGNFDIDMVEILDNYEVADHEIAGKATLFEKDFSSISWDKDYVLGRKRPYDLEQAVRVRKEFVEFVRNWFVGRKVLYDNTICECVSFDEELLLIVTEQKTGGRTVWSAADIFDRTVVPYFKWPLFE